MILLFSVMSGAPQLLNSVIEEKMSRISEVLIGSITPFELMMGKLIGLRRGVGAARRDLRAGGIVAAQYFGYGDAIRASDVALAAAVPADGVVHVRLDLHHHRRGLLRPEGRAGHDDAGDADHDVARG